MYILYNNYFISVDNEIKKQVAYEGQNIKVAGLAAHSQLLI